MSNYKDYIIVKKVDLPQDMKFHGLSKDAEYEHLWTLDTLGFPSGRVEMTEDEVALVESLPQVEAVYENKTVSLPTPVETDEVKVDAIKALEHVRAPEAWKKGFTGKGVKVAILDTGLDEQHAKTTFKGRIAAAETFVGDGTWYDRQSGHGTWCVGAVAGPNNYGVAYESTILVGKVLGDNGSGSWSGIIKGVNWAVENGAKVISMSLGGDGDSNDPISKAVNAASQKGIIMVVAAGNEQRGKTFFTADGHSPGCAAEAVTCAAVDVDDNLAPFSSWGNCLELAGPGWNIDGLGLNGQFGRTMSGTSMSTPHVAGCAVLAVQKTLNATAIKKAFYTTARKIRYEFTRVGHGVVNVAAALDALEGNVPVPAPAPAPAPVGYYPNLQRTGLSTLNKERGALLEKEQVIFTQDTNSSPKIDRGRFIPKANDK